MTKGYRVLYFLVGWLIRLFFRIKVKNRENEPDGKGYLVCSNHISASDPVIISVAMHHQVCFMSKKELFKIPIVSPVIKALGAFPVDRGGTDVGAVKTSIRLLKEGRWVGIFPQGTRHPGENPRNSKIKNGVAMISYHANADILPVFIHRKNNKPGLFARTTVIIGKPIPFESFGYNSEASGEYQRISNIIFDEICKLGEDFSNE